MQTIEENNRMGKTRGFFKKIGDIKGIFHARMSMIKDRNNKELTEKKRDKRWQEYTEELYRNALNDLDNHDSVDSHLEPDILEYEVKWTLGSITWNRASGGDRIPAELFKILKDDAVTLNMSANLENSALATGVGKKISFHSNLKERQCQRMSKLIQLNLFHMLAM